MKVLLHFILQRLLVQSMDGTVKTVNGSRYFSRTETDLTYETNDPFHQIAEWSATFNPFAFSATNQTDITTTLPNLPSGEVCIKSLARLWYNAKIFLSTFSASNISNLHPIRIHHRSSTSSSRAPRSRSLVEAM